MTVAPEKAGINIPAWPQSLKPKTKTSFEGQTDEYWEIAATQRNAELNVCQKQLIGGQDWYERMRADLARKSYPLTTKPK